MQYYCLFLTSTFLVFIVSLILGGIYSDYNEMAIIFKDLEYLVAYSIKLFGFFHLLFVFDYFNKKSCILSWFFVFMAGNRGYLLWPNEMEII